MPLQRWTITNADLGTVTFPVNPSEGVLPALAKTVEVTGPVAYDGQPIIWEGREQPRTFPIKGAGRTQTHYNFMVNWYNSKKTATVVDDLGNTFTLYLTKFTPTRRNRTNYKWSFTFDAEAVVCN